MPNEIIFRAARRCRFNKPHVFRKRFFSYHWLRHVVAGRANLVMSGCAVRLKKGDLCLFMPGIREAESDRGGPIIYDDVAFDAPAPLSSAPYMLFSLGSPHRTALVYLMRTIMRTGGPLRQQLLEAAVSLFLHSTAPPEPQHPVGDRRLDGVLRLVSRRLDQPIRVSDLAVEAGFSAPQLRHLFREKLGVSPKQYLLRIRMEYARRLIWTERLRVQEVADRLGFSTSFQFSAQYRKVHGVSPGRDRPRS